MATQDGSAPDPAACEVRERWRGFVLEVVRNILRGARGPSHDHANPATPAVPLVPLDLRVGTAFQQAVWRELIRIPPGGTRTYGDVARAIGNPGAVRAVGGACGANPIPLIIPCHRVLAAGNKLGGFSGGLPWKRLLLSREGIGGETGPQPGLFDSRPE